MCYNYILLILTFIMSRIYTTIQFQRPCEDLSEKCLTKSLQLALPHFVQGMPELGLETLDPYTIDKLDVVLPGGLGIQFRQGVARGLKNCAVDYARLIRDTLETELHCNLTIQGKYKSLGKLLMFPINGNGDSSIRCTNLRFYSVLKLKSKIEADGEMYLEIADSNVDHSYDGRVSYSMTNLLRNNLELSNALLGFINENWRMVAEEFGGPLVEYGVSAVMNNIKKLLKQIPINKVVTVPTNLY